MRLGYVSHEAKLLQASHNAVGREHCPVQRTEKDAENKVRIYTAGAYYEGGIKGEKVWKDLQLQEWDVTPGTDDPVAVERMMRLSELACESMCICLSH